MNTIVHFAVRKRFLLVVLFATILLTVEKTLAETPATETAKRPNVVLVMSDDHGYGDLSCHGNPVLKTPCLDELYRQSVRLTDFHVAPTCSPTRAALMTGRNKLRTGVWHTIKGRNLLRSNETTMANVFQDNGYKTGMFGKWHLGDNCPFRPEERGFDQVVCHRGGGVGQTPDYWDNSYFDDTYFENSVPKKFPGYCTDVWFSEATKFIKANKSEPFFAYISTNAPHGPHHAPPEDAAPYADQGVTVANFFGMIVNLDTNVGKMFQFIKDEGLAENTIFIFMTDNGSASGDKIFNKQMRGKKGSQFEGGHRVPCFWHYPAGGLTGGIDVDALTSVTDILPTLMKLCDLPNEKIALDGDDISSLLTNPANTDDHWKQRVIITDSQRVVDPVKWKSCSTMMNKWRLIDGKQLYNIESDPGQKTDIADKHPEMHKRLREEYEKFWADVSPTFNQDVKIYLGDQRENPVNITCHDWISVLPPPWNQAQVRDAKKPEKLVGFWNIDVRAAGKYRVKLSRWPAESGHALSAEVAPSPPSPGGRTYRDRIGKSIDIKGATLKVGEQVWSTEVDGSEQSADFEVDLAAGETKMSAEFQTGDGKAIGAFYVVAERISQ